MKQFRKSFKVRIRDAKRGIPTGGKLPYGRTYDRETGEWGIDEEKKKKIEWIAEQYLKDESLRKIAEKLNIMTYPNLLKVLKYKSGDTYTLKFKSERLKIDVKIPIKVPRLLPEETIKAIHAKSFANKTYMHPIWKNAYLLKSHIFCASCETALRGQTDLYNVQRYRHKPEREGDCEKRVPYIRADVIDDVVIEHLFEIFGDKAKLERAAKEAIPDLKERRGLTRQVEEDKAAVKKIKKGREIIIGKIAEEVISDDDAKEILTNYRKREGLLVEEIEAINERLKMMPSKEAISMRAQLASRVMESWLRHKGHLDEMTFDDKRGFLQSVFDGKDPEGKRYGVYLEKNKDGFIYTLYGVFGEPVGRVEIDNKVNIKSKGKESDHERGGKGRVQ